MSSWFSYNSSSKVIYPVNIKCIFHLPYSVTGLQYYSAALIQHVQCTLSWAKIISCKLLNKLKRPFHDHNDQDAYISFCNLILKLCIYVRFSELQINYHDYKDHLMAYVSLIVGKQGHISQVYISFLSLQIIYCILQAMVIHVFQFICTDVSKAIS